MLKTIGCSLLIGRESIVLEERKSSVLVSIKNVEVNEKKNTMSAGYKGLRERNL